LEKACFGKGLLWKRHLYIAAARLAKKGEKTTKKHLPSIDLLIDLGLSFSLIFHLKFVDQKSI